MKTQASKNYSDTADELVMRFKKILDEKPELKTETNAFEFFKHGLDVKDLQPSLFQAQRALVKAKSLNP